jgi:hypothetical protein
MLTTSTILLFNQYDVHYFSIANTTLYPKEYIIWLEGADAEFFRIEGQAATEFFDDENSMLVAVPAGESLPLELSFEGTSLQSYYAATLMVRRVDTEEEWNAEITASVRYSETSRDLPESTALGSNILLDDKTSFGLVRTNPKLSGNVRFTVDSTGGMWLNSYDATSELLDPKFKKFRIAPDGSFPAELHKYTSNLLDPSALFKVYQRDSEYYATKTDYVDQYDLFYAAGAGRPSDKSYTEEFSMVAPIWLREKLPEYFVILRVDGPKNSGTPSFGTDILGKSAVVKTFDLTERTALGRYLRAISGEAEKFGSPISVNYDQGTVTYNGISYRDGVYATKIDYIQDLLLEDAPQIALEERITLGFERNGMLCVNLLNMEFLFDDAAPDNYTINRYFGLYVSENELGTFQLDRNAFEIGAPNNEAPRSSDISLVGTKKFIQTNDDGVKVYATMTAGSAPTTEHVADPARFFYLRDRSLEFYRVNQSGVEELRESNGDVFEARFFTVSDTAVNLASFTGVSKISNTSVVRNLANPSKACVVLELTGSQDDVLQDNDTFSIIYGAVGSARRAEWKIVANSPVVKQGKAYHQIHFQKHLYGLGQDHYYTYYSPEGSPEEVARSIAAAFTEFVPNWFVVEAVDNKVVFRAQIATNNESPLTLQCDFSETDTASTKIKINGFDAVATDGVVTQRFVGGATETKATAVLPLNVAKTLEPGALVVTNKGYGRIKSFDVQGNDVCYVPYIQGETYFKNKVVRYHNIAAEAVVMVDDPSHTIATNSNRHASFYNMFEGSVGLFSIFPVRDFDFDFHSTEYSRAPHGELRRYFFEVPSGSELPLNNAYVVVGGSGDGIVVEKLQGDEWIIDQTIVTDNASTVYFTTIPISGVTAFRFVATTGSPKVYPAFTTFDTELEKFKGFAGLVDFPLSTDALEFELLKLQRDPIRFVHTQVVTEYSRQKENYLAEYATKSRVVPYINKWAMRGARDVRDNPYRLNLSLAFGAYGFAPHWGAEEPTPEVYTHEWPYLDTVPLDFPESSLPNQYSYFHSNVDIEGLYSTEYDEFMRYFVVGAPTEQLGDEAVVMPRQERFSMVKLNPVTKRCETFFRGAKFDISEISAETGNLQSDTRFDGYKFSAVLRHMNSDLDSMEPPVSFEVIDNKKWKALTLVISVRLDDYKTPDGILDYLSLYTTKSQMRLALDGDSLKIAPADYRLGSVIAPARNFSLDATTSIVIGTYTPKKYAPSLSEELLAYDVRYGTLRLAGAHRALIRGEYITNVEDDRITLEIPRKDSGERVKEVGYFIGSNNQSKLPIPYKSIRAWYPGHTIHVGGGMNALRGVLRKISFAHIIETIMGRPSRVKYSIVSETGSKQTDVNVILFRYAVPDRIERRNEKVPVPDINKPSALANYETIGYSLGNGQAHVNVYRYDGAFEPKFRDVLLFGARETSDFSDYYEKDFVLSNTRILDNHESFGIIRNFYHAKVAETQILRTSGSSLYKPVYPLVGETAIDKRDFSVFASAWDDDYYRLYTAPTTSSVVAGTTEMTEDQSFFGSKVMQLPSRIEATSFTVGEVKSLDDLEGNDIGYRIASDKIHIRMSLKGALTNALLADGAQEYFESLNTVGSSMFGNMTGKEAATRYIEKNILDVFKVADIQTYLYRRDTSKGTQSKVIDEVNEDMTLNRDITVTPVSLFVYDLVRPLDDRYVDDLGFVVAFEQI